MRTVWLAVGFAIALAGCAKDEACDMTGARYMKMITEGTPLSEKDKACVQAAMIKSLEDSATKAQAAAAAASAKDREQPKPYIQKWDLYPAKK